MDIRLLLPDKITRDILDVLAALADTSKLSITEAKRIVNQQIHSNVYTYIGYVEDEPVAIGTIVYWNKLIHNGSRVAIIEDVAVKKSLHGNGYGKALIDFLTKRALEENVYKVILNCSKDIENFYIKCGFYNAGLYMRTGEIK